MRVLLVIAIAAILIAGPLPVAVMFIALAISVIAAVQVTRIPERSDQRRHDAPFLAFASLRAPPRS